MLEQVDEKLNYMYKKIVTYLPENSSFTRQMVVKFHLMKIKFSVLV